MANKNNAQFEYFSRESEYASPAEMTDDAKERINQRKQRTAKLGRTALSLFNERW